MNFTAKNPPLFIICAAAVLLAGGCATPPPEPPPEVVFPKTSFEEFQTVAAGLLDAGRLAVVGSAESKSEDLAQKRALIDGRRRLARLLDGKIDLLRRSAAEETGKPADDPVFAPLNIIAQDVIRDQIQALSPARTEEETISGTVRVYCLMELDPQIIADRLIQEQALYSLLQPTRAFALLFRNIGTAEAASTY
jgi:hypothetical protein